MTPPNPQPSCASRALTATFAAGLLALAVTSHPIARAQAAEADAKAAPLRWWKGNLHTHSLWSDGDDYPEMIAAWYKDQGYHFVALTDHNVLAEGSRWITVTETNRGGGKTLAKYIERFGPTWVEQRKIDETRTQVRLKPLAEFATRLEEPDRFLLIPAEELSDRHLTAPIHINANNIRTAIKAQGGTNVVDVIQRNVNAVLAQREETGQPMFPHVNHPNFGWGITAEELMQVQGEKFFEVYNGHPAVHNLGDKTHASIERMWDIILTWRLAVLNLPIMYGLAVDDSHHYHEWAIPQSNPGRGWVMVRAPFLTPEHIVHAMEAGDFYASTGVTLRDVSSDANQIAIEIEAEPGVTYRTTFIGTRRGFDRSNSPIRNAAGDPLRVTHTYSEDVGETLAVVEGTRPVYRFRGDELYVRARVTSSRLKHNPYHQGEFEQAWAQPVVPGQNQSDTAHSK